MVSIFLLASVMALVATGPMAVEGACIAGCAVPAGCATYLCNTNVYYMGRVQDCLSCQVKATTAAAATTTTTAATTTTASTTTTATTPTTTATTTPTTATTTPTTTTAAAGAETTATTTAATTTAATTTAATTTAATTVAGDTTTAASTTASSGGFNVAWTTLGAYLFNQSSLQWTTLGAALGTTNATACQLSFTNMFEMARLPSLIPGAFNQTAAGFGVTTTNLFDILRSQGNSQGWNLEWTNLYSCIFGSTTTATTAAAATTTAASATTAAAAPVSVSMTNLYSILAGGR